MNFKLFVICMFLVFISSLSFGESKNILYISDNVHLSNSFDTKYVDLLQKFIDDEYGKDKINVRKISRFDINTTECMEFIDMFHQRSLPEAVILMVGEANYHNLYGFSAYIRNRNRDKSITINVPKNLYEINKEMIKFYDVKQKNMLGEAFSAAYKNIYNSGKIFKPKVVPDFYALEKNFKVDSNLLSTIESYRHTWSLIRDKKFDKAREFLSAILEKKTSQSMLYYALGSIYLEERKESSELNALKAFENGILVDPLNKENLCYKGIILLFMMYKGEITSEVLYFARALNECMSDISDEISAITTINTPDYNKKTQTIDDWILFDIDEIKRMCSNSRVRLIFASYPADLKINSVISQHVKNSSSVLYIENIIDAKDTVDFLIYRMSKKMYEFLKSNKIIN